MTPPQHKTFPQALATPPSSCYHPKPTSNLSTVRVGFMFLKVQRFPPHQTGGMRRGLTNTLAIWEQGSSCSRAGSKSRESRAEQKKGWSARVGREGSCQ